MATRDESEKRCFLLIAFRYGNPLSPTFIRYSDYTDDVTSGGFTYSSIPEIRARIPAYTGGLTEETLLIEVPRNAFVDRLSNGEAHAPVDVTVVEVLDVASLATSAPHMDTLFKGRLTKAVRNYNKQKGIVGLFAQNWKGRLKASLGMPALNECVLTFGGKGCRVIVPTVPGEVTQIVDNRLTIKKPGGSASLDPVADRQWQWGYIEREGLRLTTRDWSNTSPENPDHFYLDDYAPQDWLNQAVTVVAGCSKLISGCRFWLNEERFLGIGIAIPARHPVLEGGV